MGSKTLAKSIFLSICLAALFLSSGCKREQVDSKRIDAANLYSKSVTLIHSYIDSLERSNDSVEVMRIAEKFDSRFTALNYEFPPDTDLKMTEESNDSIKKLLLLLVETRKKKLRNLAGLDLDTIPQGDSAILPDSLAQTEGLAHPDSLNQSVKTSISQSAQLK